MRFGAGKAMAPVLLLAVLGGCAETLPFATGAVTPPIVQPQFLPGVPSGFECPLVPNGFDPAGSIYRLDKSGTFYRVTAYGEDPTILAMKGYRRDIKVADYVFTDEQKSSAGVSFAVLKNALPGLTASANADLKKSLKVDIVVSDMLAESIDDQVAEHILERFRKDVKPKPGSRYYLVRETIRAGKISYGLKREDLAKLGSEAEIQKLASGKANVTFKDDNGVLSISQSFQPDRVPVCLKAAEIVVEQKRGKEVSVSLKEARDTEIPTISKIGADEAKSL